jgi:hypothetical protein
MRRSGGSGGDLFANSEPEDAIPGLEDLIGGVKSSRGVGRVGRPGGSRLWLWLRLVIYAAVFLFGILALIAGATQAATDYGDASTMAHAPVCAAGVDLTVGDTDCVGWVTTTSDGDVTSIGGEDDVLLKLPSGDEYDSRYPGNAAFAAEFHSTGGAARAEFWRGDVVALTVGGSNGAPAMTVTTDLNPNNNGGVDLGAALIGVTFVLLSLLLLVGVRALRYRWLRPSLGLRWSVSAMIAVAAGSLVAGACLTTQPAQIMLIVTVVPTVTICLIALMWFSLHQSWKKRSLYYGAGG